MMNPKLPRAGEDMRAGRLNGALAAVQKILKRNPKDHDAKLRAGLRPLMRASPLLDEVGYAARFYAARRSCWVEWCASQGHAS